MILSLFLTSVHKGLYCTSKPSYLVLNLSWIEATSNFKRVFHFVFYLFVYYHSSVLSFSFLAYSLFENVVSYLLKFGPIKHCYSYNHSIEFSPQLQKSSMVFCNQIKFWKYVSILTIPLWYMSHILLNFTIFMNNWS